MLAALVTEDHLVVLGDDALISFAGWASLRATLCDLPASYHQRFPLRRGMSREEVRQRLQLTPKLWQSVLVATMAEGWLSADETTVRLTDFTPQPTADRQRALNRYISALTHMPLHRDPLNSTVNYRRGHMIMVCW
ncbi:MAG: DNA/RNA-binding winged helix domain-containing protein [Chloroflexus sp.]|uniref:DNA/RNA-binding winged helix domain-containing protein n=1 Tax=Chloroflexus sp. TaxID=1904827 RepID=UPI00404AA291